jgi:hypothetical protein
MDREFNLVRRASVLDEIRIFGCMDVAPSVWPHF